MPRTDDPEAIEASFETKMIRFRPMGEKLDWWGVNSLQRTHHSRSKRLHSRNTQEKKRPAKDSFLSA